MGSKLDVKLNLILFSLYVQCWKGMDLLFAFLKQE